MYDADIALFYMIDKKPDIPPEKWVRTIVCRKNRQDERLFTVKTKLNINGKTVGFDEPEYTAEYSDHLNMAVI